MIIFTYDFHQTLLYLIKKDFMITDEHVLRCYKLCDYIDLTVPCECFF